MTAETRYEARIKECVAALDRAKQRSVEVLANRRSNALFDAGLPYKEAEAEEEDIAFGGVDRAEATLIKAILSHAKTGDLRRCRVALGDDRVFVAEYGRHDDNDDAKYWRLFEYEPNCCVAIVT